MAVRTWANTLGVAVGAGVLAGAGQLGVVYGLGIVRWDRDFSTGGPWHAQLAWLAFLAIVSVVAGTLAGGWRASRLHLPPSLGLRVALAFAAALGSAVILPLVARPAGVAHLAESGDPRISAVLVAAVGLLVGVVAGVAVLAIPPVAGGVIATILWVWLAGLISATLTIGGGASWGSADLGLLSTHGIWLPVGLLAPAVLIALGVAAIARFGGADLRAVASCGLAGPALVGLAYLVAGPGGGTQTQAYRYALFAVCAGFAVSAIIAVVRKRRPATRRAPAPVPESEPEAKPVSPAPALAPTVGDTSSRYGVSDYGWPEPEETGPDATDVRRVPRYEPEPDPEPEPAPAPAPETAPAPVTAGPARPAKKAPSRRKAQPASEPVPVAEAQPVSPAPAPPPATPALATPLAPVREPEAAPAKTSRFSRRKAARAEAARPEATRPEAARPEAAQPAAAQPGAEAPASKPAPKPAKTPRGSRSQRREEDHVDWVSSLRADDGIRVGGKDGARHSKDDEID